MSRLIKLPGQLDPDLDRIELANLAAVDAAEVIGDGRYDIVKTFAALRRYEVYIASVLDTLKPAVLSSVRDRPEGHVEVGRSKIIIQQSRRLDFTQDTRWNSLNAEAQSSLERRKAHEKVLRSLTGETVQQVNQDTGEIVTLVGPKVELRETLVFRL